MLTVEQVRDLVSKGVTSITIGARDPDVQFSALELGGQPGEVSTWGGCRDSFVPRHAADGSPYFERKRAGTLKVCGIFVHVEGIDAQIVVPPRAA